MSKAYYDIFETPAGWMGLVASDKGLQRSTLPQAFPEDCIEQLGSAITDAAPAPARFEDIKDKLVRYFEGEEVSFANEPIDVEDASAVPQGGVACLPHHSQGRDAHIQVACRAGRQRPCPQSGGTGNGEEPAGNHHPLPPRHSERRQPARVRQRQRTPRPQAAPNRLGEMTISQIHFRAKSPFPLDGGRLGWG